MQKRVLLQMDLSLNILYVTISRSIRQGCSVAPIIYILQAESLASTIRANPNIKSIKLPHPSDQENEPKRNMFADDTQLFNRDEKSIEETFKVLNIHVYEKSIRGKNKFK
jgi:glycerol-3-phosphate O-acyltransferase